MERVRDSMGTAASWWADLRPVQKFAVVAILALVILMGGVVRWLTLPTYERLYTDLQPEDYYDIVAWLDANQIAFRTPNQETIMVLEGQSPVLKAQLAQEGMPSSGHVIGDEDLEQANLTETRAQFRKRVQRMAEGEVTRTILTMEDVRSAKVNIAYPEDEPLFEEDRVPLTASVAVTSLNPNVRLTPTTVDAIATITANSISGLDPQRVAIMDSRGRLYHPASDRDGIDPAQVLEQENQRRERERELERRLREEIGGVVGPQNVRVVASIDLDWGQESVTERALLPNPVTGEGFVISEESETEEYTGPSPQPGVPGVEPNVPPPPEGVPPTYPAVEMGPIEYSRTDDTVNTDYGERVTERKNLPPNTERKAVGIFLNEEEVSAEQLARIETVAQSQIDVARGDVIAVQLVPFAEEVMEEDVEEHWLRRYGRVIVAGLMLLIGLIVPFAVGRMAAPPPVEEEELEEGEEPEEGMAWEQLLAEQEAAEEDAARQQMIRQNQETFEFLRRTAEQNPEDFANALRAWLADD